MYEVRKYRMSKPRNRLVPDGGVTYLNEWLDVEYHMQSVDIDASPFYTSPTTSCWWSPVTNCTFVVIKEVN